MNTPVFFPLTAAQSGVYAEPADAAELARTARDAGFSYYELDLAGVGTRPALLDRFEKTLALPVSFGRNLDALADSLEDFSWQPAPGYILAIRNGGQFARGAPDDFALVLEILAVAAKYWSGRQKVFVALLDADTRGERVVESLPVTAAAYKIPVSVLVVIYTEELDVLLLERADRPGFWQSVTGSQDEGETLAQTARREVAEETGLDTAVFELADWGKQNVFEIYRRWRGRYAPGITHNTEHVFGLRVPARMPVTLAPREHLQFMWLPWHDAADRAFSWSNADAIRELPQRVAAHARPHTKHV